MRLLSVLTATVLLAISTFTSTFGVPVSGNDVLPQLSESGGLSKRAPTIPMTRVAANTWQGTMPPNVFSPTLTDTQIKAYAKATYDYLVTQTASVVLVAVIWVPGAGLAAGTIWHGSDTDFETNYLPLATRTHALVAAQGYSFIGNSLINPPSKWHAEIVAAQKAEVAFGSKMTGADQWPTGTKICIYGKLSSSGRLDYYPPCSSDSTASLLCMNVIGRGLNIAIIV